MRQRMVELEPAARYPGMILASHFQRGFRRQGLSGLVDAPFAAEHLAGEDQGLCARAAFSQAAVNQQLIGSRPQQMPRWQVTNSATPKVATTTCHPRVRRWRPRAPRPPPVLPRNADAG